MDVARTKDCEARHTSIGNFGSDLEENVIPHVALCGSHCVVCIERDDGKSVEQ